jgi:hypothetical protein
MDFSKVLAQLREELANLEAAILSLERLQHTGRRRGRPPKVLSHLAKTARDVPKSELGEDDPIPEEG